MKRANLGAGSIRPDGWDNYDLGNWDLRQRSPLKEVYDYAVANHVLSALDHHELPVALRNIRHTLRPGGVLRVMDINVAEGIEALLRHDHDWFPQDERIDGLGARFCTWVTWFGTHKSIFTHEYLETLLDEAGFTYTYIVEYKESATDLDGITDLDDRQMESLFVEAVK
jgi:predicted SAM-dependent methyltransferase